MYFYYYYYNEHLLSTDSVPHTVLKPFMCVNLKFSKQSNDKGDLLLNSCIEVSLIYIENPAHFSCVQSDECGHTQTPVLPTPVRVMDKSIL